MVTEFNISRCKCSLCECHDRHSCIATRCYCCDLEDAFSILTLHEFEPPQSRTATEDRLREMTTQ